MRRVPLVLWSYVEFFVVALALTPVFALVAAWKRDADPTYRARGKVMRLFGRVTSSITPLWRFSVAGARPPDIDHRGYVVVSNHESMADMFLLSHLPFDMRFMGKEEMFRLPFIGFLLRCSADVRVRRGKGESVRAAMEELRTTLRHGLSVMIFPEGTRSRDGNLLPFKDGAFQLAIEAGVPVLPIVLTGTRTCVAPRSAWLGEAQATATILPPIDTTGLTLADVARLREATRERITEALAGRVAARAA